MQSGNLAGRAGRWSAQHRKTAVMGWILFVVLAVVVGGRIGQNDLDESAAGSGESKRGDMIVEAGFSERAGEQVLVQGKGSVEADDPEVTAAVRDVVQRLEQIGGVTEIESPLDRAARVHTVSKDGRSVLVNFKMPGTDEHVEKLVEQPLAAVAAAQAAHPDVRVEQFGAVSATKAIAAQDAKDGKKAKLISNGLMLIILLVAFGAVVAAGIPLLLGLSAVLATMGLVAFVSQVLPMSDSVSAIILLIGLAVGVDYTMFYLKREREERAAGRSEEAALEAAAATSGRSVLISGLTVMVAMAGMLLTGDVGFASFGVATMIVVAVAMLGSLTVLPALLSKLGDKVDRGRVPFVHRLRRDDGKGRLWGAIIDRVLRRPLVSALLAGGLLVAIAVPAYQLKTAQPSIDTYPQKLLGTYNRIKAAFPGTENSSVVVIKASNVDAPAVREAVGELKRRALATGLMNEPIEVDANAAKTVATISIATEGDGTDATSNAALTALRDEIIPATIGAVPASEVAVTGMTAWTRDFQEQMKRVAPLVFGFVLLFAFGLMLVTFRSVVIAAKAVLLNLLSVAAAYGILVLVFQHGWGKGLLGFEFTGGIDPFLPILLFVILFGLSMDYHVFILSRVREAYDRGMSTDEAVAHGIKTTAGVVTSAAIVMVGVFAIFATLQAMIFKQFGVGLAAAILIDATIIRAILLPASMKLLGDWNWYLPRWLEWLPHFEHGGSVERDEPTEPVTAPPALEPTR
jgi:uncharacterized membrane protein YdfJ with MMPL/SSD domain